MTLDQASRHLLGLAGSDGAAARIVVDALAGEQELTAALTKQIAGMRELQTLGGEPPPFNDSTWRNRRLPGGPDPEYRGI